MNALTTLREKVSGSKTHTTGLLVIGIVVLNFFGVDITQLQEATAIAANSIDAMGKASGEGSGSLMTLLMGALAAQQSFQRAGTRKLEKKIANGNGNES